MNNLQDFDVRFLSQFSSIETEGICLALSGGLDSMVLLTLMHTHLSERYKMRAIHVNHNLHEKSDAWSIFCKEQCERMNIDLMIKSIHPESDGFGLEANARDQRYNVIKESLNSNETLLTAHHKDDQLETILFRIFRGTGVDGLRGIIRFRNDGMNIIFRPLLNFSRADLENYASIKNIAWIEDGSNKDSSFDRNYIRKYLTPKIKDRWTTADDAVHRLSLIATENHELLNEVASEDLSEENTFKSISISNFDSFSIPRIKNMIRYLIEKNNMPMPSMHILNSGINDLIMNDEKSAEIKWSEYVIRRFNGRLYFLNKAEVMPCEATENISWSINQSISLSHPIGKLNTKITEGNGISLDKCSSNLQIKFRKGGEKMFFNADNGSKTLKDFFNEKKILPWIRDKVPLIYDDQHLICIGDLWINENFIATESEPAFTIHWNTKMKIL